MADKLSMKLFALNLHISNTLETVLEKDPVGGQLNPTQLALFRHLYFHREENVYQRDLEKAFLLSRSTASRVLQGLESMGLITRSGVEADGRLKKLILTPRALELGERMSVFYRSADELLWEGFSAEESQMLCLMLERMRRNLTKIVE